MDKIEHPLLVLVLVLKRFKDDGKKVKAMAGVIT